MAPEGPVPAAAAATLARVEAEAGAPLDPAARARFLARVAEFRAPSLNALLDDIAGREAGASLVAFGWDRVDFREVGPCALFRALLAAYEAGIAAGLAAVEAAAEASLS